MHMGIDVNRYWYRSSYTFLTLCLLPLSWVFSIIVCIRRWLYYSGIKKITRCAAPVIVVGNITVGGTGKTPLVIWLAQFLQAQGWRPGIVSRGYGGKIFAKPQAILRDSVAREVGDEAILLAQRADCPVVICVNRVAAAEELLQKHHCNIVISDDGLQHYALGRDIEIAVIDGERRLGNGALLPAGPLREPPKRLKQVDFIVAQQYAEPGEYLLQLRGESLVSVANPQLKKALSDFKDTPVHACAAIGNPSRFFADLQMQGLDITEHVFSDHYLYREEDLDFGDALPVIMTEKDSVKCQEFADQRYWYFPVAAYLETGFEKNLLERLLRLSDQR
jgi:tetraacyldisaccharide 4'-kinase